jgi:hypothetical protein
VLLDGPGMQELSYILWLAKELWRVASKKDSLERFVKLDRYLSRLDFP